MKLRVVYSRAEDLLADHDQQFVRGGLLVRVDVPTLVPGAPIALEIVTSHGAFSADAQVIQVLPGAGVAVGFEPRAIAGLAAAVEAARQLGPGSGPAPVHLVVPESPAEPPSAASADAETGNDSEHIGDAYSRVRQASVAEKMQMALHGNKDERIAILRDANRTLHKYVVRNPSIQLDEVGQMARMTTVSQDVLAFIAGRREWAGRPEIAAALVRNPKTPVPLAVKLLSSVSPSELRQLAKAGGVREPIQRAARRMVLR